MELDEQMNGGEQWDEMDTGDVENNMRDDRLLQEAMEFGQVLMQEYRDEDREYKRTLEQVFSLIAYPDAKSSLHGHLLDPKGRVAVAEELNSAILGTFSFLIRKKAANKDLTVSLGRSSSAALERLYQQTEALIDEISQDGGPGAFVNLQSNFLA
jgi:Ran-binding protein 9/10